MRLTRDKSILQIICKKLYGFVPTDLEIGWQSLRILTAEQEENVKNSQLNRVIALFNNGLMSSQEAILSVNIQDLVGVELDEKDIEPLAIQSMTADLSDNKKSDTIKESSSSEKMKDQTYFKRYGHSRKKETE